MTLNYGAGAAVATVVDARNRIMNDPNQFVLDKIEDLAEINKGLYTPAVSSGGGLGSLVRTAMGAALGVGIVRGIGSVLNLGQSFQNKLETAAMGMGILKNSSEDQSIDQERQAFRVAFVKAAYDAGYFDWTPEPVLADASGPQLDQPGRKSERETIPTVEYAPLIGSVVGETLGGVTGALVGGEGNRLVPALAGTAVGGAVGVSAGMILRHLAAKKKLTKTAGPIGFSAVTLSPGMLLALPQAASNALMLGSRATGAAAGALDAPSSADEQEAQLEATRDLLRQRLAQAKALRAEAGLRALLAKRKH